MEPDSWDSVVHVPQMKPAVCSEFPISLWLRGSLKDGFYTWLSNLTTELSLMASAASINCNSF